MSSRLRVATTAIVAAAMLVGCGSSSNSSATSAPGGGSKAIILATTTSVEDSGLLDQLVPEFQRQSGYTVKTVAVGSGQALAMADRGEADVVIAHDPETEKQLVNTGKATQTVLMHNDFVVIGPSSDPAGIKQATTAADALKRISEKQAAFISRGDKSGTNSFELKQWKTANITPSGSWYQESGQGMGQTCQPCGGMGEACCAGGNMAMRCSAGLTCRFVGGMGQRCGMGGGGNPTPDASAGN